MSRGAYARGKWALGECARSGRKMLLRNMVADGYYPNLIVDPQWYEPKHPQESLPSLKDPVSLFRPAPDRSNVGATLRLDNRQSVFSGYELSSPAINATTAPIDPDFLKVVFLFDAEGTNGGTDAIDHSSYARPVTYTGAIALSNAQAKFGSTSLFNNNIANDYIFTLETGVAEPDSFDFSNNLDFTVELQIFPVSASGANNFAETDGALPSHQWNILLSNGNYFIQYSIDGTIFVSLDTGHNSTASTWQHLALVRNGNDLDLFKDGVKGSTLDLTSVALWPLTAAVAEMRFCDGLSGYIDEIRVTRGLSRYTTNFTPPTEPFPQA